MKIKYLKHNEINKKKWDSCIRCSENSLVYGMSWFLDAVSYKWDALVLDDYSAVLPLIYKRKNGLKYIYHAPYLQKINIFSDKNITKEITNSFLKNIPNTFFQINLFFDENINFEIPNFEIKKRNTHELYLNKKYDALSSQFSKTHRKNIRKAIKNDLKIITNSDISSVLQMKKAVFNRLNSNNIEFFINKLTDLFKASEMNTENSQIYSAYYKNELCAAAYFLKYHNRYIIFSGTNNLGRKTGAAFYLTDTFIKNNAETDTILDFAGSDIKGIAQRNLGFGSKTMQYSHLQKIHPLLKFFK